MAKLSGREPCGEQLHGEPRNEDGERRATVLRGLCGQRRAKMRESGAPARIKLRTRMLLISRYKSSFTLPNSITARWSETIEVGGPQQIIGEPSGGCGDFATTFTKRERNGGVDPTRAPPW